MPSELKLEKAREMYGSDIVSEVTLLVDLSDADGAYVHFEDYGQYEHAECVEYLYFEGDD